MKKGNEKGHLIPREFTLLSIFPLSPAAISSSFSAGGGREKKTGRGACGCWRGGEDPPTVEEKETPLEGRFHFFFPILFPMIFNTRRTTYIPPLSLSLSFFLPSKSWNIGRGRGGTNGPLLAPCLLASSALLCSLSRLASAPSSSSSSNLRRPNSPPPLSPSTRKAL